MSAKSLALLSLIVLVALTLSLGQALAQQPAHSLYEESRTIIPDNLPWYPVVVIGDNRPTNVNNVQLPPIFYMVVNETKKIYPVAVIGTGDHTGMGTQEQINVLYNALKGLQNVWLALGNHDLDAHQEKYWTEVIAPDHYHVDDIPGWRVYVLNSECRLSMQWKAQVNTIWNNLGNRSLILVFHRPIYPKVEHNLDPERANYLLKKIAQNDHVKIVLQGHWHGYAAEKRNGIEWIITGGAGAPLYDYPKTPPDNATIVLERNHYVILILYPNQTFTYEPILAGNGSGVLDVTRINSTAYRILNTKLNIFKKPAWMPVRLHVNISGWDVYTTLIAPPNSTVIVNIEANGYDVKITSNATNWYAYATPPGGTNKAVVGKPVNGVAELKLYKLQTTTTTSTTTTSTMTTTITTTTSQPSITTTTTETTSAAQTQTTTTTSYPSPAPTTTPAQTPESWMLWASVAIIIAAIIAALLIVKKK